MTAAEHVSGGASPLATSPLPRPPRSSDRAHVIVTGRNAPDALIEAADLVTEMTLVKHPFREQGVKAQAGIEF